MLIPLILSGGAGTRLWPVSRQAHPKPFMALPDGESLLSKTFHRAQTVVDGGEIWTVTGQDYYFLTREHYARATSTACKQHFLLEPVARNTAPALLAAAMAVTERHGPGSVLLVLPADHLIADLDGFQAGVQKAVALAGKGYLVTFGIKPQRAETGYGYIRAGEPLAGGFEVQEFVEKPDQPTADGYVQAGNYWWNSGMFCFTAGALVEAARQHRSPLVQAVAATWAATTRDAEPLLLDGEHYARAENISIDYAVMEAAGKRAVVAADFDWSDIGSWQAVAELTAADEQGNRVRGEAVLVDSTNCYVQGENRLIATVGLQNATIIDTADALLVMGNGDGQAVRQVVDQLRANGHPATVFHQTVHRPWGSYTVLQDTPKFKVKRLEVKPGQVLSLQRHQRRSEHWTVVSGRARVRCGDEERTLEPNQSVEIPVNTLHRLENPERSGHTVVIEVQCGDYFGEDDIERFEDIYGRI